MKLVLICGAGYFSGKERMSLLLLKKLKEFHINICCITSIWGDGDFNKMLEKEKIVYVQMPIGFISKVIEVKPLLMTIHQLLYLPRLWIQYYRYIKLQNPDVIIHTNFHHAILLLPFINVRKKNIYYLHENVSNKKFYLSIFKIFQNRFNKFIGVSDFVSDTLVKCNIPIHKVTTIHNCIELHKVENRIKQNTRLLKIGIVGQVEEWKGHEDLLVAISILKKRGFHNLKCLIVGKGSNLFKQYLIDRIKVLNIREEVSFEGFKKSLDDIYTGLDIVCVPSRFNEPFGLSALEPANYSIPVIATNTGGLPEIIINNHSGILVSPHDALGLAQELEKLIIDVELRNKLGKNSRIRLEEKFSSQTFIKKWITEIFE
jgi:glycosyltransferase involved in cell wall biosynthesis